jgi:hypothetical protein
VKVQQANLPEIVELLLERELALSELSICEVDRDFGHQSAPALDEELETDLVPHRIETMTGSERRLP